MILEFITIIMAAAVFVRAESSINTMCCNTRFTIRLAYWVICVASASAVLMIVTGGYHPAPDVIIALGCMSLMMFADRRNADKACKKSQRMHHTSKAKHTGNEQSEHDRSSTQHALKK